MKKGLKFTKEQLVECYVDKKMSLSEIGQKFGCNGSNILYWLKKFNIERRPADYRKVAIPEELLYDLYHNQKMSSLKIAEKLGLVSGRTIRKKLRKFGIKMRSLSDASAKKYRKSFSGNLEEKAFLIGLRAGDFYARKKNHSVRVQTTTTHLAQIELLKRSLSDYGQICKYLSRNKARADEWFIYVDLDNSFEFLVEKPKEIPLWILEDEKLFFQFLAAYIDCEGCWRFLRSHKNSVRFVFSIDSGDKKILNQISEKLNSLGFSVYTYQSKTYNGPFGKPNIPIYRVNLNQKEHIISLIKILLPLSRHTEKIRKMNFIINHKDKSWNQTNKVWDKLREEIKKEILKNLVANENIKTAVQTQAPLQT